MPYVTRPAVVVYTEISLGVPFFANQKSKGSWGYEVRRPAGKIFIFTFRELKTRSIVP